MTRGEMRAEAFSYLANADQLPPKLIDVNLQHGVWAIFRRMRNTRHFQQVREKFIPLVAEQEEVVLGPEVEVVVRVYRQDQGGARVWPVSPSHVEESERIWTDGPSLSYEPLPSGRIRLLEVPTVTSVAPASDGLRLRFRRRPIPLTSDDQEPDLPLATHEAAVLEGLARLNLKEGIALAEPQRFEYFRKRVSAELDLYLTPSLEDDVQPAPDSYGFYDMEGSI